MSQDLVIAVCALGAADPRREEWHPRGVPHHAPALQVRAGQGVIVLTVMLRLPVFVMGVAAGLLTLRGVEYPQSLGQSPS